MVVPGCIALGDDRRVWELCQLCLHDWPEEKRSAEAASSMCVRRFSKPDDMDVSAPAEGTSVETAGTARLEYSTTRSAISASPSKNILSHDARIGTMLSGTRCRNSYRRSCLAQRLGRPEVGAFDAAFLKGARHQIHLRSEVVLGSCT